MMKCGNKTVVSLRYFIEKSYNRLRKVITYVFPILKVVVSILLYSKEKTMPI